MGIDDHDAVVGQDHGGVAVDLVARRGNRRIDAISHRFQLEELTPRSRRIGRHRAARMKMIQRLHRSQRRARADQEVAPCPG